MSGTCLGSEATERSSVLSQQNNCIFGLKGSFKSNHCYSKVEVNVTFYKAAALTGQQSHFFGLHDFQRQQADDEEDKNDEGDVEQSDAEMPTLPSFFSDRHSDKKEV